MHLSCNRETALQNSPSKKKEQHKVPLAPAGEIEDILASEPLVREAVELFGGEVVNIRKARSSDG